MRLHPTNTFSTARSQRRAPLNIGLHRVRGQRSVALRHTSLLFSPLKHAPQARTAIFAEQLDLPHLARP
jgi:hypothetical protein